MSQSAWHIAIEVGSPPNPSQMPVTLCTPLRIRGRAAPDRFQPASPFGQVQMPLATLLRGKAAGAVYSGTQSTLVHSTTLTSPVAMHSRWTLWGARLML